MRKTADNVIVLGVDVGTTSTKAMAFDARARLHAAGERGYPLAEPAPGRAEQDPDVVVAAVAAAIDQARTGCPQPVAALSFTSAMHGLVGLDRTGAPLTPIIGWADSRATAQAQRLRRMPGAAELHRRTGVPIHPMTALTKLIWFRENAPDVFDRAAHWVGVKDYVLLRLTGQLSTDYCSATGSGLLDISRLAYDTDALTLAGITADQLPPVVATTNVITAPPPYDLPIVVGAGDGPLANVGLGAVRPGVTACSIGTSGAVRVVADKPAVDPERELFCFPLTDTMWVVGGAVNNGGLVLDWARTSLAPDLAVDDLLGLAGHVPPGCDGLLMLPQLMGERAPHWDPDARAAFVGLTREHGRAHLVRAAIEGVCFQLGEVVRAVAASGYDTREVRATGGFARSALWRQVLADVLGGSVGFPTTEQGSCLGAALLGLHALGVIGSLDDAADIVVVTDVVEPDPAAAAVYRQLGEVYLGLGAALAPTFAALGQIG